jgi:hypothetical protein
MLFAPELNAASAIAVEDHISAFLNCLPPEESGRAEIKMVW